jgi:hypothetical protein
MMYFSTAKNGYIGQSTILMSKTNHHIYSSCSKRYASGVQKFPYHTVHHEESHHMFRSETEGLLLSLLFVE